MLSMSLIQFCYEYTVKNYTIMLHLFVDSELEQLFNEHISAYPSLLMKLLL